MRFETFHPWHGLRRLRAEMDRLLSGAPLPHAAAFPPVNIWSSPDGLVVTAELPGVDPSKLTISAVREGLTIQGERTTVDEEEGRSWRRRERRSGSFRRTIELPYSIDADSVEATCRDGVLRIALKRPEEDKPKRIEVKTA